MKYHSLFLLKIRKDVTKFVICCSRDWRLKGKEHALITILPAKSDGDDVLCLQSYQGLMIDISRVY